MIWLTGLIKNIWGFWPKDGIRFWVGEVLKIDEDEDFHRSWRLPGVSLDALKLFLSEARTVIERANASIPENTFVSTLRESEFWKNYQSSLLVQYASVLFASEMRPSTLATTKAM